MFQSARLKLTFWYLVIIMMISTMFSTAFYRESTREIRRIIDRIEYLQQQGNDDIIIVPPGQGAFRFRPPTLQEMQDAQNRIKIRLIILNGVILVIAGAAGYFLAGRTLKPIQVMMDEQNQFISDASHELRTPIATMRAEMESNLLEKKISDSLARKLIKSNLEELTSLQNLSNNLLRLAETRSSGKGLAALSVPLSDILRSAEKKVSAVARGKKISITMNLKNLFVHGDAASLTELFVILFDNAIKYSPPASRVEVAAKDWRGRVRIAVKDQGVGIAAKDLPHIFERFYRTDKSRSQADGYGLGLAIAKKIAEANNGTIAVSSKINKGTIFTVELAKAVKRN